ncbi:MAG: arginase family protein [Phycisphaerae bacterium]
MDGAANNTLLTDTPGEPTFFTAPHAQSLRPGQVGLIGAPVDALVTERRGAADAPDVLRRRSVHTGSYSVSDRSLRKRRSGCVDVGNLRVDSATSAGELFEAVSRAVSTVVSAKAVPLLVGGDHSITYPAVTALAETHGTLRVVQIDAHVDATDPSEWNCRWNHGTWLRNLIEDGAVKGEDVTQIGVRDFQYSESGPTFAAEHGVTMFTPEHYAARGAQAIINDLLKASDRPVYVTLDMDAVDPAFAPGTGEPMPGGLTSREVLGLVRSVFESDLNIVGADLVEVVPVWDCAEITIALATNLLARMTDGLAGDIE